jgi:hypothetical protein
VLGTSTVRALSANPRPRGPLVTSGQYLASVYPVGWDEELDAVHLMSIYWVPTACQAQGRARPGEEAG